MAECQSVRCTDDVIKAMLTENTGTHFLDSGDAYGRHWEENNKTPPWEKDRIQVANDYVVMNVYHWLTGDRGLMRTKEIEERESEFYEWANSEKDGEAWLTCMRDYANRNMTAGGPYGQDPQGDPITVNTYSHEYGSLTQVIQFVTWYEGNEAYALLQIHQGADIRGGYTKPRLFKFGDVYEPMGLLPHEFGFHCHDCGWDEMESCLAYSSLSDLTNPEENTVECPECESEVFIG